MSNPTLRKLAPLRPLMPLVWVPAPLWSYKMDREWGVTNISN